MSFSQLVIQSAVSVLRKVLFRVVPPPLRSFVIVRQRMPLPLRAIKKERSLE